MVTREKVEKVGGSRAGDSSLNVWGVGLRVSISGVERLPARRS